MINEKIVGLRYDHLCPVSTGHFLTEATRNAFLSMSAAAKTDGVEIQIASSFRSFDRQCAIWNRKFSGQARVLDKLAQPILNWAHYTDAEKIVAILRWSALPGASRHHWGTDLDVFSPSLMPENYHLQLTPEEYDVEQGMFAPLTQWLNEHMQQFGFYRPYQKDLGGTAPEAWHLSYFPEATEIAASLTPLMLNELLQTKPIDGLDTVLNQLPFLWDQFITNISEAPQI